MSMFQVEEATLQNYNSVPPKRLIENFSNNHGDVDDVYNGNIVHIRLKRRLMIILFYFPKICKKEKLLIITTKKILEIVDM